MLLQEAILEQCSFEAIIYEINAAFAPFYIALVCFWLKSRIEKGNPSGGDFGYSRGTTFPFLSLHHPFCTTANM